MRLPITIDPMNPNAVHARELDDVDVSDLDEHLLDKQGLLKAVHDSVYAAIPNDRVRVWAHNRAVYGLPTAELVEFVRELIGGRSAIEIGSGAGCLGRALGIRLTDNKCQANLQTILTYKAHGQPTIVYPDDVEKIGGIQAVNKYRPQVVVASWVTHLWKPGMDIGCMHGVNEEHILDKVETYIMFGSRRNHGQKPLMKRPHVVYAKPWMRSRADDSVLYVWHNKKLRK